MVPVVAFCASLFDYAVEKMAKLGELSLERPDHGGSAQSTRASVAVDDILLSIYVSQVGEDLGADIKMYVDGFSVENQYAMSWSYDEGVKCIDALLAKATGK